MALTPIDQRLLLRVLREKEETLPSGLIVPEHEHDIENVHAYYGQVIAIADDCNQDETRTKVYPGDFIWYSPYHGFTIPQEPLAEETLLIHEERVLALDESWKNEAVWVPRGIMCHPDDFAEVFSEVLERMQRDQYQKRVLAVKE